jgi:RNA polymerase sigma-70 factor (ECF subfamily)
MPRTKPGSEARVTEAGFWASTFDEHASSVLAFLSSRTGRRDVAEDLLQETFVRAMRAEPRRDDPVGLRAYLFTTAHNLLMSRYRKRRPVLFSEVASDGDLPLADRAADDAQSPDRTADFHRLEARLGQILDGLPAAHRDAFRMAVIEERSYDEIARERGWTLGQVKTNVHRARKSVIAQLGGWLGPRTEEHR